MRAAQLKKWSFCFILLAISLIALYPKEIFLWCVAWKTAHYCEDAFGARLHCEALDWEEGKIVFKKGRLHKEGELDAIFEQATLLPFFDLRHRKFGGELTLEKLKIVHQKRELGPVPHPPSPSLKLFTLQLDTQIVDGEIFLYDYLSNHHPFQHAFFDLSHHIKAGQTYGSIAFQLDPQAPTLVTHFFHEKGSHLQLSATFKSQPFPYLSHLVEYFFQSFLPESVFQWDIVAGRADGNLEMILVEGAPFKMKGKISLDGVRGGNPQLKLLAELDHLGCELDIDFAEISSIHGFLDLKGGRVAIQEIGTIWEGIWDLKNVHTQLCIKEGKIESSTLKGCFMGMEGEMVLDWQAHDILMQIGFRGSSKKMQALLSEAMKKSFATAFPNDFFSLNACLKRSVDGLKLEGALTITDQKSIPYELCFGCNLGNSEPEGKGERIILQPVDFSLSRSVSSFLDNLKKQFCLSQKMFGWFEAEKIPLEKFLSPFLLKDIPMHLSGTANFKVTFDDNFLVVFYSGRNFELQSPHFLFHVDTVKEQPDSSMTAVHYFDLKTWHHVGFLPLKDAGYWQKNYDFHLEKTQAVINFENREIHIQNVITHAEDLEFKGNVALNIHSLNDIDLEIAVSQIHGSVASTQEFLSHFRSSFVWQLPLDGTVTGNDEPAFFHYHFSPVARLIEGNIQGKITLNTSSPLFTLQDYQASISYNCMKNEMQVTEGVGMLFFPKHPKPFILQTPLAYLWDFPNVLMEFSCCLEDENGICLALEGSSKKEEAGKEICVLGDGKWPFKSLTIKAKQFGKELHVSDYSYGNWSGEAEAYFENNRLNIRKFSCLASQRGGFCFSGAYLYEEKSLRGDIFGINWDLARLSPLFEKSLSPWKPGGEVYGKGELDWTLGNKLEAKASLMFKGLEFGGIYFGSGEDLRCVYSSQTGLSIEGLEVEIPQEEGAEKYKLGRFHYDFQNQKVLFEGFDFSLPPEKLPWVSKTACKLFPGKIHPMMMDWVEALKQNEPLEGRISLEIDPNHMCVYLSLKDGVYFLSDKKLNVKNFYLIYDPQELQLRSQVLFRDAYYWMHLTADSLALSHGVVTLSESQTASDALKAYWQREKGNSWSINQLKGMFCGIDVDLKKKGMCAFPQMTLEGSIHVDPQKIFPLLKPSWKKTLEKCASSGKYTFEGELELNGLDLEKSRFAGRASGKNCFMKGIQVESFSSNVSLEPRQVKFSQLTLSDLAGHFYINQILAQCDERAQWHIILDYARLTDLRLSRLKSPWTQWRPKDKPFLRHLYVPTFVLENVSGKLANLHTFKGYGKIEFTNLPKKTLFSNLLFIPTEITARIGLDLSTLVPVRGSIEYCIRDGKIYFTDLEMFSDGKRSRFYLVEGSDAFIDFKGNLNMKVKMKQYNLLMKLAEFFTISVRGTLLNPSYTLSNHRDDEDSF